MTAAVPVRSLFLYRRAVRALEVVTDFRVHPLRVLIGLLLKQSEIPPLGSTDSIESGALQSVLYEVYAKEPPFDEGRGPEGYLRLFGKMSVRGANDWRNGLNSQKGLGCFAPVDQIRDPEFRYAERPDCPHRGSGLRGDGCMVSPDGVRTCRSIEQRAGETPKLLAQSIDGGTMSYQLVQPTGRDLTKFRDKADPRVPVWPLIVCLYAGSPTLHKGGGVVSQDDLLGDLNIGPSEAGDLLSESSDLPGNRSMVEATEPFLLACLRRRLYDKEGFIVSFPDLINFYLSLKPRAFVILTGISGTGKSRLPRLFAEMTRPPASPPGSNYSAVPVRPNWNDTTDLMGFYNSLHGGFEPGPAIEAFRKAHESEDDDGRIASFMLLDELNLARVEHYFADFLSVMESRKLAGDEWVTDPLKLAGGRTGLVKYVGHDEATTPFVDCVEAELPVPDNLFVVGTVNVDETTQGISNRVLDRANTIEFEEVYLSPVPPPSAPERCDSADLHLLSHYLVDRQYRTYGDALGGRHQLVEENLAKLSTLNDTLKGWRSHFGNRTRDEVCIYMAYAADFCDQAELAGIDLEGYGLEAALDRQILQKVLPRVSGTREELEHGPSGKSLFDAVGALLDAWDCELSSEKLRRMKAQETINFWEA